jgi:hypothetical protein
VRSCPGCGHPLCSCCEHDCEETLLAILRGREAYQRSTLAAFERRGGVAAVEPEEALNG